MIQKDIGLGKEDGKQMGKGTLREWGQTEEGVCARQGQGKSWVGGEGEAHR